MAAWIPISTRAPTSRRPAPFLRHENLLLLCKIDSYLHDCSGEGRLASKIVVMRRKLAWCAVEVASWSFLFGVHGQSGEERIQQAGRGRRICLVFPGSEMRRGSGLPETYWEGGKPVGQYSTIPASLSGGDLVKLSALMPKNYFWIIICRPKNSFRNTNALGVPSG